MEFAKRAAALEHRKEGMSVMYKMRVCGARERLRTTLISGAAGCSEFWSVIRG